MKVDAIISETIVGVVEELNKYDVKRENVINVFQNSRGQYVAFYYS